MFLYVILALVLLYVFFFKIDSDLTLYFYDKFSPSLHKLSGKTVWVVGSSSGIGESLALQLAKLDCKIILTSRSTDKLVELKKQCLQLSNKLTEDDIYIADFDVTDNEMIKSKFEEIKKRFSNIDLLINNAGRLYLSKFLEDNEEDVAQLFQLNYFANLNVTREVIRFWKQTNQTGQIAVTSSTAVYMEYPFIQHYSVTKKALNAAYNALRIEHKIPITLICPGPVYTGIYANSFIKGENRNPDHAVFFNMTSERCAELSLVPVANQLSEVWVSKQYYLFLIYVGKIAPLTLNKIATLLMRESILERICNVILAEKKTDCLKLEAVSLKSE